MARTALILQQVVDTGLEATFAAANADGHYFENDGNVILEVINGDASDKTITIQTGGTLGGKAVTDTAVVVTAGERRHIGPFPPRVYNQADGTDQVYVDYSAVTSVTVAALQI